MAADSGVLLCPRVADRMQWGHRGAGTHRAIHQDVGNLLDVLETQLRDVTGVD